jgi:hypothetical protein
LCKAIFGITFADWSCTWEPFWSADRVEEANIATQRVNGIVQLVQNEIMPEQVALRQIYEDGTYSALTEQNVADFEDFAEAESVEEDLTVENTEKSETPTA